MTLHTQVAIRSPATGGRQPSLRRGAVLVEFSLVAPLMFLLILLFVEFGRFFSALHALEEAARAGCRSATLANATVKDVEAAVDKVAKSSGISKYTTEITPGAPTTVRQRELITVTVRARYADVLWLPGMRFLGTSSISGTCMLPREASK